MTPQLDMPVNAPASTPRQQAHLRRLPRVKFVQWAVRALGGKWQSGWERARGFQGQTIPWSSPGNAPVPDGCWYPIQVKHKDKAGRPDIDAFETAMRRARCDKGVFVSFDYTADVLREVDRFFREEQRLIIPLTVKGILNDEIGNIVAAHWLKQAGV